MIALEALAQTGTVARFIPAAERHPDALTQSGLLAALANTMPDERSAIAGWLLDHGVPGSGRTERGQGALQILFGQARHDPPTTLALARRLVLAGASPAVRDRAGASALGELLVMRVPEGPKLALYELVLADAEVDVDAPNTAGVSPREAADHLPGRDAVRALIAARDH